MSAFAVVIWGKADMAFAPDMSAFDPERTSYLFPLPHENAAHRFPAEIGRALRRRFRCHQTRRSTPFPDYSDPRSVSGNLVRFAALYSRRQRTRLRPGSRTEISFFTHQSSEKGRPWRYFK